MGVTVIAEAGVNHNGSVERALALVDAAARAGADIVKFQTFRAAELAAPSAAKADYQKRTTDAGESQLAMLRRLELDGPAHRLLLERCQVRGIEFLSTPFDMPSLRFLVQDLALSTIKISSGDLTNGPLLLAAARSGRRIILSTGMGSLEEVGRALSVLAYGLVGAKGTPSYATLGELWTSKAAARALRDKVTLLHCTTEYPAPADEVNLRAMVAMAERFGLETGYSDHTQGTEISVAAVALGASVIEKHFTLDRALPGPDHAASLEPDELAILVRQVRTVHSALGDGIKRASASETKNMPIARKSLVALRRIEAGEVLTEENVGAKRPGTGISPMRFWDMLGRTAERSYDPGEAIEA